MKCITFLVSGKEYGNQGTMNIKVGIFRPCGTLPNLPVFPSRVYLTSSTSVENYVSIFFQVFCSNWLQVF